MTAEEFEKMIGEEFENAIPEKFRSHIKNVAFLAESEPSEAVRTQEGLRPGETLLGFYQGVPYPMRGDLYGMGTTMPDTITLYQNPIEDEAREEFERGACPTYEECMRKVIRETIWHEVAHLFGMDEHTVRGREDERKKNG